MVEKIEITHLHPSAFMAVAADGSRDSWAADIFKLTVPYRARFHFHPEDVFSCYLEGDPLIKPAAPSLSASITGGSLLTNTLYRVQVTALSPMGETDAFPPVELTTPGTVENTATITVTFGTVTGALSYNVYLSTDALPLLQGNYPSSPQTITTAGTGVTAPTVNTAADEMPDTTKVRVRHCGLMGDIRHEILAERNYITTKPFTDTRKLMKLGSSPVTVIGSESVVVQVKGLAVSGGDVNPAKSAFRLGAHWEREGL